VPAPWRRVYAEVPRLGTLSARRAPVRGASPRPQRVALSTSSLDSSCSLTAAVREEKTTLSELEKTFSEKIANAEESPKMEQDDKSIHILRKSIGSFLGGDADDQFGQDDD